MKHATRPILVVIAAMFVGGCSATPSTPAPQLASAELAASQPAPEPVRVAQPAAALAFSNTLPPEYPLAGLDRDARQPSAFFGYESTITESYVLYTDDDQNHYGGVGYSGGRGGGGFGAGWGDNYERRAISVKTGVVER